MFDYLDTQEGIGQPQDPQDKNKIPKSDLDFLTKKPSKSQIPDEDKQILTNPNLGTSTDVKIGEEVSESELTPQERKARQASDAEAKRRATTQPQVRGQKTVDNRTEEQKKADFEEAQRKAQEEYLNKNRDAYNRIRMSRASGKPVDAKDEEEFRNFRSNYRTNIGEALRQEREKLYAQGYTTEAVEKKIPNNPRAGLFGSYEQNRRLEANGLNRKAITPESDAQGVIQNFSSSAFLKIADLENYEGAELRRKASNIFYGYQGFDEQISDVATKAWELNKGNESLFVSLGSQKPVNSVFDLFVSGDVLTGEDGDVTMYRDDKAEAIEYALVAQILRQTGIDLTPENVAKYAQKYQDLTAKKKEEETKDLREYAEKNLPEDQRGTFKKFLDGIWSIISPSSFNRDESVGNRGNLIKELLGDRYTEFQNYNQNDPSTLGKNVITDSQLDELARKLVATQNYKIQLTEDSMYQALANIPDPTAIELVAPVLSNILKTMYPEQYKAAMKDASNYVPSTQELGAFSAQLGTIILGSAVGGGVGSTLATLAVTEKTLRDSNPDTYNMNMAIQVIPVGIGNALTKATPILGRTGVGGLQIGLGAGQTVSSYGLNWEMYKDEKGQVDVSRIFPELILDTISSGFDAPDFIAGIQAKRNPMPHQIMNMLVKTEAGDYAMFVKNPDSGVFELTPVKAEKAQAWAEKQKESGRPFIEQVMPVTEYNGLLNKFGSESVGQALNHALFGTTNPVRELSKQFEKSPRVDTKQKIVDGEVQVTEKINNPKIILDETGAVPVKVDTRVARRIGEVDENREFSVLNILANHNTTLNKNSNLLGDGKIVKTLESLEANEYITIDGQGNIRATSKGIEQVEKLNTTIEGFEKFITRNLEQYGSKFDKESKAEVASAMKDNRFFSSEKKPFSFSIQEIMTMGQKQKEALAMMVAIGDAEFNKQTGVLKNTEFEVGGRKIGRDADAYVASKVNRMEKAFSRGNTELGNAIAKDILDFQGKDSSPESVKKFVEGDPEAPELAPQPTGSLPERVLGRKREPESLTVEDAYGRKQHFVKDTNTGMWRKAGQQVSLPDAYVKSLVDDGTLTVIGDPPRSWQETRQSTKENYKKASGAVKSNRIPETLTREEADRIYADEGDLYNVAIWNQTAKEWREANPEKAKGGKNMRDYATVEELEVLDRLEKRNVELIDSGMDLPTRVVTLNREAIRQTKAIQASKNLQKKLAIPEKLKPADVDKEINALSRLFGDESPEAKSKYGELAKAIRNEDDVTASQILRDLVPDTEGKTSMLGSYYQASVNVLRSNDFAMAADSIPSKIRNLLGLSPKSDLNLSLLDHQKNLVNWMLGGEIKLDQKTKINLSDPSWDGDAPADFVQSKSDSGVFYTNNGMIDTLRNISGKSTNVLGVAWVKASDVVKLLQPRISNMSEGFRELTKELEKLGDKPVAFMRVNNVRMGYDRFVDVLLHEGTHKQVFETIGGTRLFSDNNKLSNIFNTKEGQIIGKAVQTNPVYRGSGMEQIAHEVLAFGSNLDTLENLGIKTPEEISAFVKTYARLLTELENEHGKNVTKEVTKYQNKNTRDAIKAVIENERRIRQNQLQEDTAGLGLRSGEWSGQVRRDDERAFGETPIQRFEGSGHKRIRIRRLTRDGNPYSLTGVAGAETQRRIREGAKPTLNFYVMKEDGTFVVEREFKAPHWKSFDTDFEGKFADLSKERELREIYANKSFSEFQKIMEGLGYNGFFFFDSFAQGDAFNYRVSLFDNEVNRFLLSGEELAMAGEAYQGSASPVPFERFDSRFLLSGEGNMAFGAGWYLAQDKYLADHYRKSFGKPAVIVNGENTGLLSENTSERYKAIEEKYGQEGLFNQVVFKDIYDRLLGQDAKSYDSDGITEILNLLQNGYEIRALKYRFENSPVLENKYERAVKFVDVLKDDFESVQFSKGHLIKALVKPDLSDLIDLDRPLSEQPRVKDAVVSALENAGLLDSYQLDSIKDGSMRGYYLIKTLEQAQMIQNAANPEYANIDTRKRNAIAQLDVSKFLRELGFRGNIFLDGNSRKKGEGSRNFVIFADDDVDIIARAKDVTEFEMAGIPENLKNSPTFMGWAKDSVMFNDDGTPIILHHGTRSRVIYDTPDVKKRANQLGFHLGTVDQSNKFVLNDASARAIAGDYRNDSWDLNTDLFGNVQKQLKDIEIERYSKAYGYPDEMVKYIVGDTDILPIDSIEDYVKNNRLFDAYLTPKSMIDSINRHRELTLPIIERKDRIDIYVANFKNPIILDDFGDWNSTNIISQLTKYTNDEARRSSIYSTIYNSSSEEGRDIVVNYLNELGYDSVKYWNRYEGEGWSYIALKPEQVRPAFDPYFANKSVQKIREQEEFAMADSSTPEQRKHNLMKAIYRTPPDKLAVKDVGTLIREGFWSAFTSVRDGDTSNQKKLKDELIGMGYQVKEVDGVYGGVKEPAFLVYYPNASTSRVIQVLSNKYNQESALHGKGGEYWLEYGDGSTRYSNVVLVSGMNLNRIGVDLQKKYAEKIGLKVNPEIKKYLNAPEPEDLKSIADEYMSLDNAPNNPDVAKAYNALINETGEQYRTILESGIKIEAWAGQGEPYKNSKDMLYDITSNNHYYYLKTEENFGSNDDNSSNLMLTMSELKDSNGRLLPNNDVFRIVHDLMGHTGNEWQFGIRGEWNAFISHSDLYSKDALPALMAETFMQNAVVATKNYKYEDGKYILNVNSNEVEFAPQKNIIPSRETVEKINKLKESTNTLDKKDGTFVKLNDGTVRFSIDFDWSDEALIPPAKDYDLTIGQRKIEIREKLQDTSLLTPDELSKIWNGDTEWLDAKGDKIDPTAVYDSTGKKVGNVEIDEFGQEYVMDGKTRINIVDGVGKGKILNYYVGRAKRDNIGTIGMFQQLMELYNPDNKLTKPTNEKDMAEYNAKRAEIYKANIKRILNQWDSMSPEDYGGLWYRAGVEEFARKVGKDIKVVGTEIGKLWLALVTAVTSPNTTVRTNTEFAVNALASMFRYYETGKLSIPKYQYDNQGNLIVKPDGTPKQLGLGSAQLEKIEMLIKGYVPADTAEGWSQFYANDGNIETVRAGDILGDKAIAPKTKYIRSATAETMIQNHGSLNGVINFLLSESVDGKKFNKAVDILGDKLGSFFSNLAGQAQIPTIDTWMNRYFMGMTGEALEVKRDKKGLVTSIKDNSANFDPRDGDFFRATIQKAVQEWNAESGKNITPADAQAIIWTQVKHLFNSITKVEADNIDFSQAYDKMKAKMESQQPLLPMYDSNYKLEMPKAENMDVESSTVAPKYLDPKYGENYFIEQDSGMTFAMASQSEFDAKKSQLNISDELLRQGDFESWINLASSLVTGGFLHDSEVAKIQKLSNEGNVVELQKYVLSLNQMGVLELFSNIGRISLLLGVKNIAKNIGGNSLKVFMDEISSMPVPILDMALIAVNKLAGGTNFDRGSISLVTNPVASLRMYKEAFGSAFDKGIKDSIDTFTGKHQTNFEHPSFSRERTTGWRILKPLELFERYGWRFQGALDRPFNAFAYQRAISELQTLRQREEATKGNKISYEEAADYLTPSDIELAEFQALRASYQEHNKIANKYYSTIEGLPPTWRAILNHTFKFVKTPLNVVDYVLDYTGFWQLAKMSYDKYTSADYTNWKDEIKKSLDNPQDRVALSRMVSQGAIGSIMLYVGFKMAESGVIQGFFDEDDRKEREYMEAKNISYGSIQIAGKNVDISWLSPVAFYLMSGASMFHDGRKYSEKVATKEQELAMLKESGASEDAIKAAEQDLAKLNASSPSSEVINRILKNIALQTPFLRQGYDLVKSTEQGKLGEGLFNMLVQPETFVPAIVKEVAETMDTTARVIRDDSLINKAVDKVKAKIPVVRESLPVKYDMLGRPIETGYGIDPFRTENIDTEDPLLNELQTYGLTIPKPTKGTAIEKNEERKARGDFYRPYLDEIVASEQYQNLTGYGRSETLKDALRYLGTAKREKIAKEYVDHKIEVIRMANSVISDAYENPSKYKVSEVTDKDAVMNIHRANIDPKKLNIREIVNSMGQKEWDKFINDMMRYNFEPRDNRSLEEAKINFEKFKQNPSEYILNTYISDLEYNNRKQRLAEWRKELRDAGKTEKEIDREIRSRSSKLGKQTGYKFRKNSKIVIPDSFAERMIQNQTPSQNIEDVR